jgi:hypothetical protein
MLRRSDPQSPAMPRTRADRTERVVARYAAGGTEHLVVVGRDPVARWQVVDRAGVHARLVETLNGHDYRLAQAEALARDYAAERQSFHQGRRLESPLPARSAMAAEVQDVVAGTAPRAR